MRTFWKWAVVLAVPAIWVATARPQEPALPEGTTVKLLLLRQKSVQKELDISADVAKKVMEFTEQESEAFGKALGMPEDERKKAVAQLEEKNKKFLADTLDAKQSTRLNQLYLQFTAPYQLTRAETAKALDLTEDQQQKFKDLYKEYRKEMRDILFGKDTEGRAEKFAKLREMTRPKILAILTEKQQAQVREVVGPPFMGEIVFEDEPKKE
jgi:Spy/CpxP family protein refolding chaperone